MSLLGTRAGREGRRAKWGQDRKTPAALGGDGEVWLSPSFMVLVICLGRWFWNSGNNFMLWKKRGREGKKTTKEKAYFSA